MHEKRGGTEKESPWTAADRFDQRGSVGACVSAKAAGKADCRATGRRVGDGATVGRVCVVRSAPHARRSAAPRAEVATNGAHWGRRGKGTVDDIRVFTGRGREAVVRRPGGLAREVSCLKPWLFRRWRRRFFLRLLCRAGLPAALVTWGQGLLHSWRVASPCGRHSQRRPPHPLCKCPSKLRKIKHLHRKRGATHYRGQTGRQNKGCHVPRAEGGSRRGSGRDASHSR